MKLLSDFQKTYKKSETDSRFHHVKELQVRQFHLTIGKSNKLILVWNLELRTRTELRRLADIEPKNGNKGVFFCYHSIECTLKDTLTAKIVVFQH